MNIHVTKNSANPAETAEGQIASIVSQDKLEERLDAIIGHQDVKQLILDRFINPLRKSHVAERLEEVPGGSMMLVGPPGSGKTSLAKAAAAEAGGDFYEITPSAILNQDFDLSAQNVANVFTKIEEKSIQTGRPAVIFVDDCDAIFSKQTSSDDAGGAMHQVFAGFRMGIEKLQERANRGGGLLLIGCTNLPWLLDRSLVSGFNDMGVHEVPLPNREDREKILHQKIGAMSLAPDVNLEDIAMLTLGYSGRDLDNVCKNARTESHRKSYELSTEDTIHIEPVTRAMFLKAVRQVKPVPEQPEMIEWRRRNNGCASSDDSKA